MEIERFNLLRSGNKKTRTKLAWINPRKNVWNRQTASNFPCPLKVNTQKGLQGACFQ